MRVYLTHWSHAPRIWAQLPPRVDVVLIRWVVGLSFGDFGGEVSAENEGFHKILPRDDGRRGDKFKCADGEPAGADLSLMRPV